jgi:hypothetical protein
MTPALASTTAAARRFVLVPAAPGRRADDPVRRFRLARMRVEVPATRSGRAAPQTTAARR